MGKYYMPLEWWHSQIIWKARVGRFVQLHGASSFLVDLYDVYVDALWAKSVFAQESLNFELELAGFVAALLALEFKF